MDDRRTARTAQRVTMRAMPRVYAATSVDELQKAKKLCADLIKKANCAPILVRHPCTLGPHPHVSPPRGSQPSRLRRVPSPSPPPNLLCLTRRRTRRSDPPGVARQRQLRQVARHRWRQRLDPLQRGDEARRQRWPAAGAQAPGAHQEAGVCGERGHTVPARSSLAPPPPPFAQTRG